MEYLNEKEFDLLCRINDKILFEKKDNKFRQAISILHVIREHPVFLKKYIPAYRYSDFKFLRFIGIRFISTVIKGLLKLFMMLFKTKSIDISVKSNKKVNGIIISHFLNSSFLSHKDDFYFASLSHKLSSKKESFKIFYINYSSLTSIKINKILRSKNKIVLPKHISFKPELKISFSLFKEAISILKESTKYNGLEKRLRILAALDSISSATHFSLRLEYQMQELIKHYKPKYLYTTIEGHSWERIIFNGAKHLFLNLKTIGYQHALMFKKQHAIKLKLSDNFNPDYILTSGSIGRDILVKSGILSPNKIHILGSPRIESGAKFFQKFKSNLKTVLLLPEGDYDECKLFFDLLLDLAQHNSNWKFIIRFHPLISTKKIKKLFVKGKIKNIEFSKMSLEEDLNRSNHVVYRGTTAIIKAIQYGLYPIYFKRTNELSINPITKHNYLIETIENYSEFEKIKLKENLNKEKKVSKIQTLIKEYLSPIDYQLFLDFNDKVICK